ncbi:hypothetical protein QYE76_008379 [Lolium multiflorum]|uniref:Uncharacterized protein n=1 Tax=Lolium multiflorum TaxID=4521 RepID=A0AAD8VE59_LOLMU|nr:hypothetical protein QYE76_008379 [Lolium multiflorum]
MRTPFELAVASIRYRMSRWSSRTPPSPRSHPAAAAVDKAAPNGAEEVTLADPVHPAKSYAAVAANAEIDDLRATKLTLEDQLAVAANDNTTLAAETHRLEGLFAQARDDVATAEHAAATEAEAAALRAEVARLLALLDRKRADREDDERQRRELEAEVGAVRQAKRQLQEEIHALKASAAVEEREVAPTRGHEGGRWGRMAGGGGGRGRRRRRHGRPRARLPPPQEVIDLVRVDGAPAA